MYEVLVISVMGVILEKAMINVLVIIEFGECYKNNL